jgi:SAM-dependent methyltransferase
MAKHKPGPMPLVDLHEISGILRCPRCRSAVTQGDGDYGCAECGIAAFPSSRGRPALVDFDRSVLRQADLSKETGVLKRKPPRPLVTFLRRHLMPYNDRAAANAERFLAGLRERSANSTVLIVGGGAVGSGAEALYDAPGVRLVAFDLYGSENVQLIADAHHMPFADGSFDGVWVQAVLEHVLEPQLVVDEIGRVLRDGGLVYAETPFLQAVHEGPYDFTRFTDSGHRWLFRRFELIDSGAVLGPFAQLLWSINQATRALFRSAKAGLVAQLLFFWLKYLDRLVPDAEARDGASALFLLARKSGARMSPHDAVAYYRGAQRR